jgi:hypothetical protein
VLVPGSGPEAVRAHDQPNNERLNGNPAIEIPQRRRAEPSPTELTSDDTAVLPRLRDPADLARVTPFPTDGGREIVVR